MVDKSHLAAVCNALGDDYVKRGLKAFCDRQRLEYAEKILSEVKKPQPDNIKNAQFAGRMDAYETFMNELEHFLGNNL